MRIRPFAFLALLAVAVPAKADVQAAYSDGTIIEISDEGAIRGNVLSEGHWQLHIDGRDYLIVNDGGVDKVLDSQIVAQVAFETIPPMLAQLMSSVAPMTFGAAGPLEINGRSGMGYRVDDEPEIAFVISDDPKVRDVGAALAVQFRAWTRMSGPMGSLMEPIGGLLDRGTAIRFGQNDLLWVADGELDDARFTLPGAPLDRYETEELMRRTGMLKTG